MFDNLDLQHVSYNQDGVAHWIYMHRQAGFRPCCHMGLLNEVGALLQAAEKDNSDALLRHVVVASSAPVFNLGGDLEQFATMIRARDRDGLMHYGQVCVDGVFNLHHHFDRRTRVIALVQGDALGGGMELALSCQAIVMERGARMGLPEVMFGLFPGMGAYSFLRQRVSPQVAERMILGGQTYEADELLQMGVVDVVVPRGMGPDAVRDLVRHEQRTPHAHLAVGQIRRNTTHISHEELSDIVELWVDTALKLPERSLKIMERLVRAQYKTLDKGCPPEGAPPPLAGEVASNQLNPRSCAQCSDERQR